MPECSPVFKKNHVLNAIACVSIVFEVTLNLNEDPV